MELTGDRGTLRLILPKLLDIVEHHLHGTRFGIRVDPEDGLLTQGAPGYQLTWMDAKVEDWVVTPRRGKAVEINGLWYNALRLLEDWLREEGDPAAEQMAEHARRARESFNAASGTPRATTCMMSLMARRATTARAGRINCSRSRSSIRWPTRNIGSPCWKSCANAC